MDNRIQVLQEYLSIMSLRTIMIIHQIQQLQP